MNVNCVKNKSWKPSSVHPALGRYCSVTEKDQQQSRSQNVIKVTCRPGNKFQCHVERHSKIFAITRNWNFLRSDGSFVGLSVYVQQSGPINSIRHSVNIAQTGSLERTHRFLDEMQRQENVWDCCKHAASWLLPFVPLQDKATHSYTSCSGVSVVWFDGKLRLSLTSSIPSGNTASFRSWTGKRWMTWPFTSPPAHKNIKNPWGCIDEMDAASLTHSRARPNRQVNLGYLSNTHRIRLPCLPRPQQSNRQGETSHKCVLCGQPYTLAGRHLDWESGHAR